MSGASCRSVGHRLGPLAGLLASVCTALGAQTAAPPATLQEGKSYALRALAANTGARIEVISAALLRGYGAMTAPEGRRLLVLDTRWENTFPLTRVGSRNLSTEYSVPVLHDHLYVVASGRVVRLLEGFDKLPGCLPDANFGLPRLGSTLRGNLVFDLPARIPTDGLELRFYDFAHGHMVVPLTAAEGPVAAPRPIGPPGKNSVVEAAVFSMRKSPKLPGLRAPQGMTFMLLDLRARSTTIIEADAAAFDPKATTGAKTKVGSVTDWKDSRKYIQLVVDGEYGYGPLPQSDLPEEPRFLPDVMTGGLLVFLVPEKYQSLELRCDFPNAALPDGTVQRPQGITLSIGGTRPPLPDRTAVASAKDEIFEVAVVGQRAAGEFAGTKAEEGQQFLILDVTVNNIGKQQEFFQTKEQLKYVSELGAQVQMDAATVEGPRRPSDLIYVPAGERRTFQVAYRIASTETRPRLAYAAVTEGASKVLVLQPLSGPAVAQKPPEKEVIKPVPPEPAGAPPQAAMPKAQAPESPSAQASATPQAPSEQHPVGRPTPHGPAKGLEGVGLTAEQVNAAIDRGSAGLWALIKKEDLAQDLSGFGSKREHILCALALVHSKAHKRFPDFDSTLRGYLTRVDAQKIGQTYDLGLLCMLIEGYGDPTFGPKLRSAARWLLEAQGPAGTWNYSAPVPDELFQPVAQTKALQITGGAPAGQRGEDWKRLTEWNIAQDGDNSVTQYALLGLQAASRSGIRIPRETWKRALDETRNRECEDGGWHYHQPGGSSYGSMTSAGICGVAICRHELGETDPTEDAAISRGLTWLDQNFSVDKNPNIGDEWVYYYLYSLERVGRILDTEFVGEHEWYPLGAAKLVHSQKGDGTWVGWNQEEDPRIATSFALLFLTRATPTLRPAERHGPGTLRTAVVAPDNRFYIILDASGSMLDEMDGKMKFDLARGAVRALVDDLPSNSQVALRVYGHRKRSIEPDSDLDTELKIPMGPLDKKQFDQVLGSLCPRGKTPLALSLEQTIQDLGEVSADEPVTVLLLTDGGEDTTNPRGNPIKAAEEFGKVRNVRFHIVGFDINQPDWSEQLQTMAQKSGAKYWPAPRGAELLRSVKNAVLGIPEEFAVLDNAGREVFRGHFGDAKTLPEGKYRFQTVFTGWTFADEFYISPEQVTAVTFDAALAPAGQATAAPPQATAAAPAAAPQSGIKSAPKFCTHCGAPLKPGQKFCTHCGAKVGE